MLAGLLKRRPFLVLDGAMGTALSARGFDTADPLWSAKALYAQPALVRAVHASYLAAGADIVESASYQATVEGFCRKGFSREVAKGLMRRSVALARAACAAVPARAIGPFVAASGGPYGAYLADGSEYRGDYRLSRAELFEFHAERIAVLAEAGPDLFACETVPVVAEAVALAEALGRYGRQIPAWISFSCRDGAHTASGETMAEAARALKPFPQVEAVGVNCTDPGFVCALVRALRAALEGTGKEIVAYPNAGETYDAAAKAWRGAAKPLAGYAAKWLAEGARILGGCCRTTPADIRALAALREARERGQRAF